MTAFIQPAETAGDSRASRDKWWKMTEPGVRKFAEIKNTTFREQGDLALVDYMVPRFLDTKKQKHVHAYLAGGDIWVEVHISKADFQPKDQPLFDAILRTLSLKPDYLSDSWDYWRFGAIASNNTEYDKARGYFQKSLKMDQETPRLDKQILRRMIADLGLFSEMADDFAGARKSLEYGLSKYPDYPLYHYNLACVNARSDQKDDAQAELRLAYTKPKADYPELEPLFDPLEDECFKKFAEDPSFVKAVQEMKRSL